MARAPMKLGAQVTFHVMRDDLQHSELMLARHVGAHRGNIGNMRGRIIRFREALPPTGNYGNSD